MRATGALLGPPSADLPDVTVPFAQTFRITNLAPAANPDQVTLTWPSGTGFTYVVNGSSDLLTWTLLTANIVATSATATRTITDPWRPTSPKRFYRARLIASP